MAFNLQYHNHQAAAHLEFQQFEFFQEELMKSFRFELIFLMGLGYELV